MNFHLAVGVSDLKRAEEFYVHTLGAKMGRKTKNWIDFDFHGHQLSLHKIPKSPLKSKGNVAYEDEPLIHLGVVISMAEWSKIMDKLGEQGIKFTIPPHVRFKNGIGEQQTVFFRDPFDNYIEIKCFSNVEEVFST